jgi:hypothetical protein
MIGEALSLIETILPSKEFQLREEIQTSISTSLQPLCMQVAML